MARSSPISVLAFDYVAQLEEVERVPLMRLGGHLGQPKLRASVSRSSLMP